MRVLVCGGREFSDFKAVNDHLTRQHGNTTITHIIHGAARGADSLAGRWARDNYVPEVVFRAKWQEQGKKAGILRNIAMLNEGKPDLVVAFPGGRGTAHMVSIARKAGVPVHTIELESW